MNKNYQKHLTYEDRLKIEECIAKRLRKYQTAEIVGKTREFDTCITTKLI